MQHDELRQYPRDPPRLVHRSPPDSWFDRPVELIVDREELTIIGSLPLPGVATERFVSGTRRGGDGPDQGLPRGDPPEAHRDRS
jgi:hypothetical protein